MGNATDEYIAELSAQIGGLGRAIAILTATLHAEGVINGNAVAASLRLDNTGHDGAHTMKVEIADLIRRTIERDEHGEGIINPIE